jgi:hypothetical protein
MQPHPAGSDQSATVLYERTPKSTSRRRHWWEGGQRGTGNGTVAVQLFRKDVNCAVVAAETQHFRNAFYHKNNCIQFS